MRIRYFVYMALVLIVFLAFWTKMFPLLHQFHVLAKGSVLWGQGIMWCLVACFAIIGTMIFERANENPIGK